MQVGYESYVGYKLYTSIHNISIPDWYLVQVWNLALFDGTRWGWSSVQLGPKAHGVFCISLGTYMCSYSFTTIFIDWVKSSLQDFLGRSNLQRLFPLFSIILWLRDSLQFSHVCSQVHVGTYQNWLSSPQALWMISDPFRTHFLKIVVMQFTGPLLDVSSPYRDDDDFRS